MYRHLLRRTATPAVACLVSALVLEDTSNKARRLALNKSSLCEAAKTADVTVTTTKNTIPNEKASLPTPSVLKKQDEPLYENLFPLRQLHKPKVEYPLWDEDWDGKAVKSSGDASKDVQKKRFNRKNGVTRHIILIRHGQYDETHKEDHKRILTPLGREQADLTGRRIAEIIKGIDAQFGPCNVKTLRVSNMTRAKETANIISQHLPDSVQRADPDPNLNESRPCHHIPGGKASENSIAKVDEGQPRIQAAFESYFYRAEEPLEEVKGTATTDVSSDEGAGEDDEALSTHPQHEFEIIVCHANVIRYFLCRALQIPPEAWLRLCTFNCSLTYLTIRPTGGVSCRMLGDIGHLGYDHSTFSMHHGFNW